MSRGRHVAQHVAFGTANPPIRLLSEKISPPAATCLGYQHKSQSDNLVESSIVQGNKQPLSLWASSYTRLVCVRKALSEAALRRCSIQSNGSWWTTVRSIASGYQPRPFSPYVLLLLRLHYRPAAVIGRRRVVCCAVNSMAEPRWRWNLPKAKCHKILLAIFAELPQRSDTGKLHGESS